MSGTGLSTKGLITGAGSATPVVPTETVFPPPPAEPAQLEATTPHGTVMIVVPTAVNVILLASENIVDNLKVRNAASLDVPSLYKRAYLIAYETDEIAVAKEQ